MIKLVLGSPLPPLQGLEAGKQRTLLRRGVSGSI